MLRLLLGFFILSLVTLNLSYATFSSFVEDNDLYVGIYEKNKNSDITEQVFNEIIDKIATIYEPIVESAGGNLVMNKYWSSGTVNASAMQQGRSWKVNMYGGLARHETITPDGFAIVVCHELGHHLGGAPKIYRWIFPTWATNEGQSDYFSTLKCMRRYMKDDNNIRIISRMDVPQIVKDQCDEVWSSAEDSAICQRSAMGGLSTGRLFEVLRKLKVPVDFETPDTNVVKKTENSHPDPQCRLDTYFAGALCYADVDEGLNNKDPIPGTCNRINGYTLGVRPKCWYKP